MLPWKPRIGGGVSWDPQSAKFWPMTYFDFYCIEYEIDCFTTYQKKRKLTLLFLYEIWEKLEISWWKLVSSRTLKRHENENCPVFFAFCSWWHRLFCLTSFNNLFILSQIKNLNADSENKSVWVWRKSNWVGLFKDL